MSLLLLACGIALPHGKAPSPQGVLAQEVSAQEVSARDLPDMQAAMAAGKWHDALRIVNEAISRSPRETRWLQLRARCLFELGRLQESERDLRQWLARSERTATPKQRAPVLLQLAEVCVAQGADWDALQTADVALVADDSLAVRRAVLTIYLRAQRFDRIPSVAAGVLKAAPDDATALFALGVAEARAGKFAAAAARLERFIHVQGADRDALFELALVEAKLRKPRRSLAALRQLLENDPYDSRAVHQASRQLLALKLRDARRLAAYLMVYSEELRELVGESSAERHLRAAGQTAAAAVERAQRWERLRAYEQVVRLLPVDNDAASPNLLLYKAEFFLRRGLYAEALATTVRPSPGAELQGRVRKLREAATAARQQLEASAPSPVVEARKRVAESSWPKAAPALVELLRAAVKARRRDVATETARLLLAVDPKSQLALRYLIATTDDPTLIVPRLHYTARLARLRPKDAEVRRSLEGLRGTLEGR